MASVVGAKGQVVIEKEIRNRLGISPGTIAIQTLVGTRVEIRFIPPSHTRSLYGILAPHLRRKVPGEDWAKVKALAWQVAAREQEESARRLSTAPRGAAGGRRPRKRNRRRA